MPHEKTSEGTSKAPLQKTPSSPELREEELAKVSGGTPQAPTPKPKSAFEIKDFSFGVENPTT